MPRPLINDSIAKALTRSENILFRPFAKKKWLALGVASWLANINEFRGLGAAFDAIPQGIYWVVKHPDDFASMMQNQRVKLFSSLLALTIVLFAVYLVFRWFNCRGQFMLLDVAVNNDLDRKASWHRNKHLGNSLLKFRIGWDLLIFNIFLVVMIIAGALVWPDFRPMLSGIEFHVTWWTKSALIFAGVGGIASMFFISLGTAFIDFFMVPVMYVMNLEAKPAFRHALRNMFRPNRGPVVRFLLTMMIIEMLHGMAMEAATIVVILCTLGIGLVLLAIPLICLLPLYPMATMALAVDVFSRSTCLYFIGQFGPEYKVNWQPAGRELSAVSA